MALASRCNSKDSPVAEWLRARVYIQSLTRERQGHSLDGVNSTRRRPENGVMAVFTVALRMAIDTSSHKDLIPDRNLGSRLYAKDT